MEQTKVVIEVLKWGSWRMVKSFTGNYEYEVDYLADYNSNKYRAVDSEGNVLYVQT